MWTWKALTLSLILTSATITEPVAADSWSVLEGVIYEETGGDADWQVVKTFPSGYEAMTPDFRIKGYPVIFEAQADVTEVMLVPEASSCPFCGGDQGYGPALSVSFRNPISIPRPDQPIVVEGRLEAIHDPQTYEAFRLRDARLGAVGG
ncbi:MAG: hypothetical protein AAF919_06080 [Pseudomonadota bacterium]